MSSPVGPEALRRAVARRVRETAAATVAGADTKSWPHSFSLGRPSGPWLRANFSKAADWAASVRREVPEATFRRVSPAGIEIEIPMDAVFASIDEAAAFSGTTSLVELLRGRRCQVEAAGLSPAPDDLARVLGRTDGWEDAEFTTLVKAAEWFQAHDASGMRPREVPIAGASGKWLEQGGRETLVSDLSGKHDLGLVSDPWPVTYRLLDPAHLQDDHAYAVALPGHVPPLPYEPAHVVIVENLSTFLNFPAVERSVAVYGAGKACVSTLPGVTWLEACPDVAYWGDMDADGLEILDAVRARHVRCRSILMDEASFDEFEPTCGTRESTGKRSLAAHRALALIRLEPSERALYERLTGPGAARERSLRVEQERIPYEVAVACLTRGK